MKNSLPNLPSALIRIALADLKACEIDSDYRINMNDWHNPVSQGIRFLTRRTVCEVCLAGAVMAKTLGYDSSLKINPMRGEGLHLISQLSALDDFRGGYLRMGVERIVSEEDYKKLPNKMYTQDIAPFSEGSPAFHRKMNQFADELQALGL